MLTKNSSVFIILLFLSAVSFCQQTVPFPLLSKEDYLAKSKKQRLTSFVLEGVGIASAIGSIVYGLSGGGIFDKKRNEQAGIFVGIGLVCEVAAIPFVIASRRNYKKAAALSARFINEEVHPSSRSVFFNHAYPTVSLKINL
jgi:hypothetical protein